MATILSEERRARLLEILARDGALRLDPVAEQLGVSAMTVRRDLDDLEAEGLARRVRGGAVAAVLPRPFRDRMSTRSVSKSVIARKASDLLPATGAVAFDASTTSGVLLGALAARDLVVATNSIDNAATARHRPGVRSVLIGGELDERSGSFVGAVACRAAASLGYARFFTSASAVSPGGTSEVSLEEAQLKDVFAQHAEETILLLDSSKIGHMALAQGLDWSRIDLLVTELDPRDERLDPYRDLTDLR
ncbi:DeoR/GlpR family DNA-binding transcription regulator [Leifsonia sp. H3M29-4]|uniref:DeoR/GlpR family DNA-binding transcription regulator n=1 Tax=Salinibacterium metalliresistens TaxID=3031321 RepID=UPI0023D9ED82|nr:DeoR/GlpR family DNA-binding transcription regulator [Salinibacterium metalliresistens]MDF1477514.1 DeoR/GlpR family DNA-binding transcription regulator [Salinibacterium metalliresistens]